MDDRQSRDDESIDEALEETFPASDPPAHIAETGAHPAPASDGPAIRDNVAAHRLEIIIGDEIAFLDYRRTPTSFTLIHTEVPPALRGRHLGEALVRGALTMSRAAGLRTVVVYPFARAYLRRHPELLDSGPRP